MKELLQQSATYHLWANQRLLDVIGKLPDEQQRRHLSSSFPTLYDTVLHMYSAESIWWQRLKLQEHVVFPGESFNEGMPVLIGTSLKQSQQWEEWVPKANLPQLEHVFQYRDRKGVLLKLVTWQMLQHVFNHGTYHRGQLVTMLRQLGMDKLPSTDFSTWILNRK